MFRLVAFVVFTVFWACRGDTISYYKVLGVNEKATSRDVKKAYRHLAITLHPDKLPSSSQDEKDAAQGAFVKLAKAYEVLSDSKVKRRRYDYLLKEGVTEYDESKDWSYIDQNLGIKPMHHRDGAEFQGKGSRMWSFEEAEKIFENLENDDENLMKSEDMPILYQVALVVSFLAAICTPIIWSLLKRQAKKMDTKASKDFIVNQAREAAEKSKIQTDRVKTKTPAIPGNVARKENIVIAATDPMVLRLKWISQLTLTNIFEVLKSQSPSTGDCEACYKILEGFLVYIDEMSRNNDDDDVDDGNSTVMLEMLFVVEACKLRKQIAGSTFLCGKLPGAGSDAIGVVRRIAAGDLSDLLHRYLLSSNGDAVRVNKDVVSRLRQLATELEAVEEAEERAQTRRDAAAAGAAAAVSAVKVNEDASSGQPSIREQLLSVSIEVSALLKRAVSEVGGRLKGAQGRGAKLFATFKSSSDGGMSLPTAMVAFVPLMDCLASPVGRESFSAHLDQEGQASDLQLCEFIVNTALPEVQNESLSVERAVGILSSISEQFLGEDAPSAVSFLDTGGDVLQPAVMSFADPRTVQDLIDADKKEGKSLDVSDALAAVVAICEQGADCVAASFARFQSGQVLLLGDQQKTKDFQHFARAVYKASNITLSKN